MKRFDDGDVDLTEGMVLDRVHQGLVVPFSDWSCRCQ